MNSSRLVLAQVCFTTHEASTLRVVHVSLVHRSYALASPFCLLPVLIASHLSRFRFLKSSGVCIRSDSHSAMQHAGDSLDHFPMRYLVVLVRVCVLLVQLSELQVALYHGQQQRGGYRCCRALRTSRKHLTSGRTSASFSRSSRSR